ncbi:hypothetical protein PoB_005625300 [Plakobranchus ocellatus]|uniref:Uncharacterized protein n=1 Tax=Plakobranchus ocellatus TaxID=259542 RepID=A0AAV4CE59_9GAST|nr:hypothetical protein PoB_005625300 [Plakobranchus ocellatus]
MFPALAATQLSLKYMLDVDPADITDSETEYQHALELLMERRRSSRLSDGPRTSVSPRGRPSKDSQESVVSTYRHAAGRRLKESTGDDHPGHNNPRFA